VLATSRKLALVADAPSRRFIYTCSIRVQTCGTIYFDGMPGINL
jgi:hypothetical protein